MKEENIMSQQQIQNLEEQQQLEEKQNKVLTINKHMTLMEKLSAIQKEINAPKSQFNKFGNYKYRNCEDILEALKPYLMDCTVTVTDEVKTIPDIVQTYTDKEGNEKKQNGLVYVEATATFRDNNKSLFVKAQAGINLNRKGMDIAQSFGASSSYARKYALAGLFLLDDNKDADSKNNKADTSAADVAQAIKDNEDPF
jgi:hypothetical protein